MISCIQIFNYIKSLSVFDVINNREFATLFWISILLVLLFFVKSFRGFLIQTSKIITSKNILILLILFLTYVCTTILVLNKIGFWEISLIKDTIFWLFGVAFVLLFSSVKANDTRYFKKIAFDCIKWIVIFEFIVNIYVFCLPFELSIIPVFTIFGLLQVFFERDEKYHRTGKFFGNILSISGILFICVALYKTAINYQTFLSIDNLKGFSLPPVLTLLFIPFIYLIALYSSYELLFIRLPNMTKDRKIKNKVKYKILRIANFNINKLNNISSNLYKVDIYSGEDIDIKIKKLSKSSR